MHAMQRKLVKMTQNNKMILGITAPIAIVVVMLMIANIFGNAFHQEPAGMPDRVFSRAEMLWDQGANKASGTAEKVFGGVGWLADKTFEAIEKVNREPNGKD